MMRTLVLAGIAATFAGCSAVPPAYYSQRVHDRGATAAFASGESVEEPAARPRRAARTSPTALRAAKTTPDKPAQPDSPPESADVSATSSVDRQTRTREEFIQEDREAMERRERALKRTMNTICRGC